MLAVLTFTIVMVDFSFAADSVPPSGLSLRASVSSPQPVAQVVVSDVCL